uniref:DNA repair protein RecO n=1 Tax=mine drainage metagenome TaxID=410659 RepID=E6QJY4_9ZZZZ
MAQFSSDAVVLRVWPVNEADLVVSFFTRDYGKLKGVAKAALKSRKRFGGSLELMTEVRAYFADRPRQELVRLDHFDMLRSPLSQPVDYLRAAALSFYAEVLEEALPDHDPEQTVFRLLTAVLEHTSAAEPWLPVTYFSLWLTRLMGWLPELSGCTLCGCSFADSEASFHPGSDGLHCEQHRLGSGMVLSEASLRMAQRMLRAPLGEFAGEAWPRRRGQDLRRFTIQSLERHLERKLRSAEALRKLGG